MNEGPAEKKPQSNRLLEQVAYENWRNLHGSTPKELEELGYSSPNSLAVDIEGSDQLAAAILATTVETNDKLEVVCGDCLTVIKPGTSCGDIKVDLNGDRKILG
ncbi:hypothetical protein H6794_01195 [Candidatus Nomurabacteria bacterium]|jgi:predicted ATP-grasp superfamily ATP-dependent carboligase|nr:hypothetical protein [Candidatus Saccharibacteria bacterium]MCA9350163.1 hypothetical protein [Candidatus Saccharibacteria bacterium]MCB9839447.1 hypothetical protein [Candidatus Nomurabacteria bacterium]